MKNNPVASFTKVGDIYVSSCGSSQHLFPHTILPAEWPSCEDAYQYTWSLDKGKDLVAVATSDREKLARSMGFCPHNRCQLSNLTSTGVDGRCPANLCYTKLENGARSFGACCFVDGAFNSGQLIGYYNKTQHTPKPIYKKYRVILGDKTGGLDESFNSFINANEIHDRLIVTQCPLESTVLDVQQMLVEQNVTLWIQLAPYIDQDPTSPQIALTQCTMTPTIFLSTSHRMINSGNSSNHNLIRDISMEDAANINFTLPTFSAQYLNIHYRSKIRKAVQEEQKTLSTHGQSGTLDMQEAHDLSRFTENTVEHRHRVMNLWYSNWKDFAVPPTSDEQVSMYCMYCMGT